jgi:hypothetical protein
MKIQEKITQGDQAKAPQGAHRVGAQGDGSVDRRARREAWAKDNAERLTQGLPPRGVLPLRVIHDQDGEDSHHG